MKKELRTVSLGEELPGHVNGFDLEVIAKRPISEHLEEGVVVSILAYSLPITTHIR